MGNIPPSLLRQPPPPPPRRRSDGSLMDPHLDMLSTLLTNKGGGNTAMVEDNRVSVNRRTRPYYFRRCKRSSLTNTVSLPDDLLFRILLHLSAEDIYDTARLVCRKWYHMIHTYSFRHAHLQHTACGLLFQYRIGRQYRIFISMQHGKIEISKFSYESKCPIWASCNGLVLGFDLHGTYALYIVNPATKQLFGLPPLPCNIFHCHWSGIAYAAASMEYKVAAIYDPNNESVADQCAILTVGVDNSWRRVSTEHLSPTARKIFRCPPLITEGFMHWAIDSGEVLTLNVENEVITETPVPLPQVYGEEREKFYMSTGRHLSLLIACEKFLWEVWEMKPETGKWTKLPNIDLEAQRCRFEQFGYRHDQTLVPAGWLKYPEVLVFCISKKGRACIFYNLHTHEIDSTQVPDSGSYCSLLVHTNSLVLLGGC